MNASELKARVESARPNSVFFSRESMRFAGDTMRNYIVTGPHKFRTHSGQACEVYTLHRRRPVKHGLQAPAYFRTDTFAQTFGEVQP